MRVIGLKMKDIDAAYTDRNHGRFPAGFNIERPWNSLFKRGAVLWLFWKQFQKSIYNKWIKRFTGAVFYYRKSLISRHGVLIRPS